MRRDLDKNVDREIAHFDTLDGEDATIEPAGQALVLKVEGARCYFPADYVHDLMAVVYRDGTSKQREDEPQS